MAGTHRGASYRPTGVIVHRGVCYVLRVTEAEAKADLDPPELVRPVSGEVPRKIDERFFYGGRWFEPLDPPPPTPAEERARLTKEPEVELPSAFLNEVAGWLELEIDPEEIAQRVVSRTETAELSVGQLARVLRRVPLPTTSFVERAALHAVVCQLHLVEVRQLMQVVEQDLVQATQNGDLKRAKSANVVLRMHRDMAKLYESSIRHARSLKRIRRR
jgi:hypothetical protein